VSLVLEGKRKLVRPRLRLLENSQNDLRELKLKNHGESKQERKMNICYKRGNSAYRTVEASSVQANLMDLPSCPNLILLERNPGRFHSGD
jgi:hypothetical protein